MTPPRGPASRRSFAAVVGSVFGVGIAYGALTPLLSLRLEALGTSSLVIGLQGAMFPLATLAIGGFLPALVARASLLAILTASLAVAAVCALGFPLFPSLSAWFALRFAMGAAGTTHWITSEIWMNALATARDRSRLMGVYATLLAAGIALGPLVVRVTGTQGVAPFAAVAAGIAVAALPLAWARSRVPELPKRQRLGVRRLAEREPGVLVAALLAGTLDAALFVFLPLYGLRAGLPQPQAVTLLAWFMAGNVLFQIPLGWWADHGDRRRILHGCVACSLVGALLLPVLAPDGAFASAPLLSATLFLWGGTSFGLYALALAELGERTRLAELAAANTAFVMVYEIGSLAGPVLAGAAMGAFGRDALVFFTASGCVAFFAAELVLRAHARA